MVFIVIGVWLAGVIVSLINHNRKLPITIFAIGTLVLAGQFTIGFGFLAVILLSRKSSA